MAELPVFVETNIETRLVVLASGSESISDFKRKIASEHMKCFPEIGEIEVRSLKVRRRGSFYHLSDIMRVWTAFHGFKGSWFLCADASRTSLHSDQEKPLELGASGGTEIDERSIDDNRRDLPALTMSLEDRVAEKDIVNDGFHIEDDLKENFTPVESPVKKCKLSHGEDIGPSLTVEDIIGDVVPVSDNKVEALVFDAVEAAEVMLKLDQKEKSPMVDITTENSGMRNDQSYTEKGVLFDETALPAEAVNGLPQSTAELQTLSGSDPKGLVLENGTEELIVTEELVAERVEGPHFSGKTVDADGKSVEISSGGIKRMKKKSHKSASKTRDALVAEDTFGHDASNVRAAETSPAEEKEGKNIRDTDDEHEEITEFPEKIGDREFMPSQLKASVLTDPETESNQANCDEPMLESNAVLEPESLNQKWKRTKSEKKHVATNVVSETFTKSEVDQEPAIKQSQDCEVLNSHAQLVDFGCGTGDINSDRDRKKRKKKSNKKDPRVPNKSVEEEQASKAVSDGAGIASLTSEEKEGHIDFSQSHNYELVKIPQVKLSSDSSHKEISRNEENCFQQLLESNHVAEQDTSVTSHQKKRKKKKTTKKTIRASLDDSAMEKTDTIIGVSSSLLESGNGNNVNDVHMGKNDPNMNNKIEDVDSLELVFTQPEKYLEDIAAEKQKLGEKTGIYANYTEIVDSNQEKSEIENTQNKDKKGKKGGKKKDMPGSSDVQAKIIDSHLQVSSVALSTEQEKGHDASSQDLPPASEGTHVEMHGAVANTDGGSQEPVENVDEGIKFKSYFVPSESKDDATDVEKTAKPNKKEKTRKKAKKHDLPSVGNTPELQNPDKPLENQKGEDGSSRLKKRTLSKLGDATPDYDSDKVVPGPIKRSSITSVNEVKNPSPADATETKAPKKPRNASSRRKEDEKPMERSQTIPEKKGSNNSHSDRMGATTKSATKTLREKSLLSKSGPIFQDMSGDSCSDDNGAVHSDARAESALESSSTSDSSDGESNMSPKAGPMKRGTRLNPKLNLSSNASEELTIDTLLRRSKRFKDAKMIAASSQNQEDAEEMEFFPESKNKPEL